MWPWVAILALVLLVAAVAGNPKSAGPPLAPTSTSPPGAKALVELVQQFGATVDVTPTPPAVGTADTVLVLRDELNPAGRAALQDWVRGGGTLVVADPTSDLDLSAPARAPGPLGYVTAPNELTASCSLPATQGIGQIDPTGGVLLRRRPGVTACFSGDSGGNAYLLAAPVGRGTVVQVGGPAIWTNGRLGHLDNSVLAVNLLAPRPGTRLVWLRGRAVGGGHASLWQLVPARVKEALAVLVLGGLLVAAWRGRRLGRPVLETPPVEVPGSELVVAVGHLLQQGHRVEQSAALLRSELSRTLVDRLGVAAALGPEVLAEVAAARTGMDRRAILATLAGPVPTDEAGMLRLAQDAARIRQEVARVR
jgi:hypothetical protein